MEENCCICNEALIKDKSYQLDCNHIFHKKCIFLCNKDKSQFKCALCRGIHVIDIVEKIKIKVDSLTKLRYTFDSLISLMDNDYYSDSTYSKSIQVFKKHWFVFDDFALYLYQLFIKKTECQFNGKIFICTSNNYIYINNKINPFIKEIESLLIQTSLEHNVKNLINVNGKTIGENVIGNASFPIQENSLFISHLPKEFKRLDTKKKIEQITLPFEISCKKIAVRIERHTIRDYYTLKFYIHKDFYSNCFKNTKPETLENVEQYRQLGFDLIEIT